jgi:hypothetical protein
VTNSQEAINNSGTCVGFCHRIACDGNPENKIDIIGARQDAANRHKLAENRQAIADFPRDLAEKRNSRISNRFASGRLSVNLNLNCQSQFSGTTA